MSTHPDPRFDVIAEACFCSTEHGDLVVKGWAPKSSLPVVIDQYWIDRLAGEISITEAVIDEPHGQPGKPVRLSGYDENLATEALALAIADDLMKLRD